MTNESISMLKKEANELYSKMNRLSCFLEKETGLFEPDQYLLEKQLEIMREYYRILGCRIGFEVLKEKSKA